MDQVNVVARFSQKRERALRFIPPVSPNVGVSEMKKANLKKEVDFVFARVDVCSKNTSSQIWAQCNFIPAYWLQVLDVDHITNDTAVNQLLVKQHFIGIFERHRGILGLLGSPFEATKIPRCSWESF